MVGDSAVISMFMVMGQFHTEAPRSMQLNWLPGKGDGKWVLWCYIDNITREASICLYSCEQHNCQHHMPNTFRGVEMVLYFFFLSLLTELDVTANTQICLLKGYVPQYGCECWTIISEMVKKLKTVFLQRILILSWTEIIRVVCTQNDVCSYCCISSLSMLVFQY